MASDNTPITKLLAIRQRLIHQITVAQQLFDTKGDCNELLTVEAGLKNIEELIETHRNHAA
jgi:hypothetical protein